MKKFALIIMTIMIWHLSYSQGNSNYYYDGYNAHFWANDSTSAIMIIKNMNNYTQILNQLKNTFVAPSDEIIENDEENNIIINSSSLNTIDIDSLISAISVKSDDIEFFSFSKVINGHHYWLRNEVFVKLTDLTKYNQYVQGLLSYYGVIASTYEGFNEYSMTFGNETPMMEFANRLKDSLWVEYSTPDLYCEISDNSYTPDDPMVSFYAGYDNNFDSTINISKAWDFLNLGMSQIGSSNIKVAVLDHGIDGHVDFFTNSGVSKISDSWSPIGNNSGSNNDNDDHGQNCAGVIISTHNSIGTAGIAPDCRISAIRITNRLGKICSNSNIRKAIRYSWQSCNAAVLSNSWSFHDNLNHPLVTNVINEALSNGRNGKGCVVVFAAGNKDHNQVNYPSSLNAVISVGAITNNLNRVSNSDWGSNYGTGLNVVSFGEGIPTTSLYNTYTSLFSGTSAACPQVSGVAALMLSANPNLPAVMVKNIIEQTAQKIRDINEDPQNGLYNYTVTSTHPNGQWNIEVGYGLIDAHAAVMQAYFYNYSITATNTSLSPCTEYTYSLSNSTVPNGTTLTWTTSNNIEIVSGQGTSSITVRPIGYGLGWISANFKHEGYTVTKTKNVDVTSGYTACYNNYTANSTMVLPSDAVIAGTFTINSGKTVTISSTARCSPDAKIFIQTGAKLIVDGGTITNLCSGKMWDGIYVVGDIDERQLAQNQGTLEIKNGALIENAKSAIVTWDGNNYATSGGIVKCSNSTFRNNGQSIRMLEYYNHTSTGSETDNVSYAQKCTFIVDNDNIFSLNNVTFSEFIRISRVRGVSFKGSSFRDGRITAGSNTKGIWSEGAGFSASEHCSLPYSNLAPCTCTGTEKRTKFSRLGYGIYATNDGTTYNFTANHAIFDTCYNAVYMSAINNSKITRSNFDISTMSTFTNGLSNGIYSVNCSGYTIEGNVIGSGYTIQPYGYSGRGIYIENSGTDANSVYRNTIGNVKHGIYTSETNSGLQLQCNEFTDNFNSDISIFNSISGSQGSSTKSAGNKFSGVKKINSPSTYITYYHSNANNSSNEYCPNNSSPTVTRVANITANNCAATICIPFPVNPPNPKSAPENDDISLYESLQQMYNTRLAEFNAAGYGFLLQNFDENDADIVAIARLKQDTLITISRAMAEIANRNINAILGDSILDRESLNGWYNRINTTTAKYSLVNSYFETGNYGLANQELASIPQRFALSSEELAEYNNFCDYNALRESVYTSGRNYAQLTADEIAELEDIADLNTGVSSAYANSVLCFFYGICRELEEPGMDNTPMNNKNAVASVEENAEPESLAVYVYPNPADEELNILLNSMPEGTTIVEFHDVTGRLVLSEEIKSANTSINISSLKQGVYMYRIVNGDNVIARDRIIKE